MTSTILSVLLLIYGFHLWIIEYEIFSAEFKVSVEKEKIYLQYIIIIFVWMTYYIPHESLYQFVSNNLIGDFDRPTKMFYFWFKILLLNCLGKVFQDKLGSQASL